MLRHETFEGGPLRFGPAVQRPGRAKRSKDAGIEDVELVVNDCLAARPPAEHGQTESQEQILQDGDVAGGGAARHFALPGDGGDVELGAVREAHCLEEAGEGADVANDALGLDFLLQIEPGIRPEHLFGVGRARHQGQQADGERSIQGEVGRFGGHERVHRPIERSPSQQIDAPTAELPRTRSGERESSGIRRFQDGVDHGEKFGYPLDFVDDHVDATRLGCDHLAQALGAGPESPVASRVEEIQIERVRKLCLQPGRFACPPRPEEEEALLR